MLDSLETLNLEKGRKQERVDKEYILVSKTSSLQFSENESIFYVKFYADLSVEITVASKRTWMKPTYDDTIWLFEDTSI